MTALALPAVDKEASQVCSGCRLIRLKLCVCRFSVSLAVSLCLCECFCRKKTMQKHPCVGIWSLLCPVPAACASTETLGSGVKPGFHQRSHGAGLNTATPPTNFANLLITTERLCCIVAPRGASNMTSLIVLGETVHHMTLAGKFLFPRAAL